MKRLMEAESCRTLDLSRTRRRRHSSSTKHSWELKLLKEFSIREPVGVQLEKKLAAIEGEIISLADGTCTIGMDTFCRLFCTSRESLAKTMKGRKSHVCLFMDGTLIEVGIREEKQFSYDECVKLLKTVLEFKASYVLLQEMAQELRIAPETIKSWFGSSNGRLEMKPEGEKHALVLERSVYPVITGWPYYISRTDCNRLTRWVQRHYKGERNWKSADAIPKPYLEVPKNTARPQRSDAQTVDLAWELISHPSLLARINKRCNGSGRVSLVPEFNIVLPYQGTNGAKMIRKEAIPLLRLYCELFVSEDGLDGHDAFARKAQAAYAFIGRFDKDNPVHVACAWLVNRFVREHLAAVPWRMVFAKEAEK